MNPLSWMIAFIGIFEKIDIFTTGGILIGLFSTVGILCLLMFSFMGEEQSGARYADWYKEYRGKLLKILKWPIIVVVVCSFINIFALDRNYMIMIAASEVGEMALATDGGKQLTGLSADAVDLLKVYINSEKENIQKAVTEKAKEAIK